MFTPGVLEQVITHYMGYTAAETKLCQYCGCTPPTSTFPKFSWGSGTTMVQMPKIILLQQIIQVWTSDHHVLLLQPKCIGDMNVLQPMASGEQSIPQHQWVTVEIAKWFMQKIVFT